MATKPKVTRFSRDLVIQIEKAAQAVTKATAAATAVKKTGPAPRVTRFSRDLALELKAASAALKKAERIARRLTEPEAPARQRPKVTRFSRDL